MDLITLALSKQFTEQAIQEAVKEIGGLTYEIVDVLPTTGEKGVVYLLKVGDGSTHAYEEYIYLNNKFERLGYLDLSDYYTKEEIDANKQDKLNAGLGIQIVNNVISISSGLTYEEVNED